MASEPKQPKVKRHLFAKTFLPIGWLGQEIQGLKSFTRSVVNTVKSILTKQTAERQESFDEALARLGITKADAMKTASRYRVYAFVFAGLGRREVQRDDDAGDEVLLQTQFADVEGMADVLGVQREQDGLVDGNGERADDDVVAGGDVVGRIEAEVVAVAVVDFIRVQRAELAVGAGVAEIEGELFGLNVDVHRARFRRSEIDRRPDFRPDERQRQDFDAD